MTSLIYRASIRAAASQVEAAADSLTGLDSVLFLLKSDEYVEEEGLTHHELENAALFHMLEAVASMHRAIDLFSMAAEGRLTDEHEESDTHIEAEDRGEQEEPAQ